ncbi:class I SAM-dependent DNA methyltransferase [Bacillus sp. 1NLA3E]|uniref:class I SAM-dependent DNA methyltransferase n=1 Tax=Bacillus sp. 1NLA3E TaxID=666686 RepID=UPI000247F068|nr:class I SAM-dependent methyltransferase [Bacillus sp. 1NLA3E]AGK54995.1 CheR-type MCP methyltransferase [Bacillus sp. 1NLA3E]
MTYNRFAYLYDELMKDTPYDAWVEKVVSQAKKYQVQAHSILDVACGTGELSVWLAEAGFAVTGVDLSDDMLAVAHAKAADRGLSIHFFQQNMTEMEGFGQFDVITIFCDSLNYLQTEEEVIKTFQRVFEHLQPEGLFMFDVHSLFKMNEIFKGGNFSLNDEKISYIWQCFEGEWPNSVEHDLSFFVLDDTTGQYDRFDELHLQRTYSIDQYEQWLNEAGFQLLDVSADFSDNEPHKHSERIFFTAKKQ